MSRDILPLFYDHSCGRSILTFWSEKDTKPDGPQSIISLCKKAGLKECYFVSNNFHTFIEAWKGLKDVGIQLRFGLELLMVEDAKVHTDESRRGEHKIIVFAQNAAAYKDLIKVYTACHASMANRYYVHRFDYKQLKPLWTDRLTLVVPYWDSFLHRNTLGYGANIVPELPAKPVIFREIRSGVPYAGLVDTAIDRFNEQKEYEEVAIKTIYYEKREDFEAYMTFRAIENRGSFNVPNVDFLCSPRFCFEEWEELTK